MNRNFYTLVENDHGDVVIESYTFSQALKTTENLAVTKEFGKVTGAFIYESDKVLTTSEKIKDDGKMIVSLRILR